MGLEGVVSKRIVNRLLAQGWNPGNEPEQKSTRTFGRYASSRLIEATKSNEAKIVGASSSNELGKADALICCCGAVSSGREPVS
jgi:hypothetical protein